MKYSVKFLPGEYFWGGAVIDGTDMPITADSAYSHDFRTVAHNQMMPMFLSSCGRYIWSEASFNVWVENGELCFEGGEFELTQAGTCLRDAYLDAMRKHFPFSGKQLPRRFFQTAQYNTWMEFTYRPTQAGVLEYAHSIIEHGFAPGILIIDEGWHGRYGVWQFDEARFPDPRAMVDELHDLGFIVMLWVTPYVCADGEDFILQTFSFFNPTECDRIFLRNKAGDVALMHWWNGYSAMLDLRKDCDRAFLDNKLRALMENYGVDGFKFDGGSYGGYQPTAMANGEPCDDHDAAALNIAWNDFGARYTYHEYKDTFKGGGKATIQRLCDRGHRWDGDGINTLLPCSLLQGLFGHPFICPDMIGGGEWTYSRMPDFHVDEELFIRMAQTSALFPMMQFSWAPWRVLSDTSFQIVLDAANLHREMAPEIIALVAKAEQDGEPILRNLSYNYPHCGYEAITDQFMLGTDILVCPVITKGTFEKDIVLPPGKWRDMDGHCYDGGQTKKLPTPLEKLLWLRKIS